MTRTLALFGVVALISFGCSGRVKWPTAPYSEVRAYYYNPDGQSFVPILKNGDLHRSVQNQEGALLSPQQVSQLLTKLGPFDMRRVKACYKPRHAFIFRNGPDVIATLSVCLECFTYRSEPDGVRGLDLSAVAAVISELGLPLRPSLGAGKTYNNQMDRTPGRGP